MFCVCQIVAFILPHLFLWDLAWGSCLNYPALFKKTVWVNYYCNAFIMVKTVSYIPGLGVFCNNYDSCKSPTKVVREVQDWVKWTLICMPTLPASLPIVFHKLALCTPAILTLSLLLDVPYPIPFAKSIAPAKNILFPFFLYLLYSCSRFTVQLNCHLFTDPSVNPCQPYPPQPLGPARSTRL